MWNTIHFVLNIVLQKQFWEIVGNRTKHVAVHGGHVDTKTQSCSLFPVKKENQYSR